MGNKVSKKQTTKPQYDPQKNYKWQPDDIFELSGIDFSTVFNTLKEAALSPTGTSALNIVASYNLMQSLLIKGIEEGVIVEVAPKTPDEQVAPAKKTPTVRKAKATENGQEEAIAEEST